MNYKPLNNIETGKLKENTETDSTHVHNTKGESNRGLHVPSYLTEFPLLPAPKTSVIFCRTACQILPTPSNELQFGHTSKLNTKAIIELHTENLGAAPPKTKKDLQSDPELN